METIYVLGSGAVGFPLAAFLSTAGRNVVAVRTSPEHQSQPSAGVTDVEVRVRTSDEKVVVAQVPTMPLSSLKVWDDDSLMVITSKAYANGELAHILADKISLTQGRDLIASRRPLVVLQNGLSVEKPFLELLPQQPLIRGVLYVTSQRQVDGTFSFRAIQPSPLGLVYGDEANLLMVLKALGTEDFPMTAEPDIRREVWKKTIVNAVFNSICPLLEVDNGFFSRDASGLMLAQEMVSECITLTRRLGVALSIGEVMQQILRISRGSTQWISTLQDIKNGRRTEMDALNLAIAEAAAVLEPPLSVTKVEWLGKMVLAKSRNQRSERRQETR